MADNPLTFYTQVKQNEEPWYQVSKTTIDHISEIETQVENIKETTTVLSSEKENLYSYSISDVDNTKETLIDTTFVQLVTTAYKSSRNIKVACIDHIHVGQEYYVTNYVHSEPVVIAEIKAIRNAKYTIGNNVTVTHIYDILLEDVLQYSYTVDASGNNAYIVKSNMSQKDIVMQVTKDIPVLDESTIASSSSFKPVAVGDGTYSLSIKTGTIANIQEIVVNYSTTQSFVVPADVLPTPTGTGSNTTYKINIGSHSSFSNVVIRSQSNESVAYNSQTNKVSYQFQEPYFMTQDAECTKTIQTSSAGTVTGTKITLTTKSKTDVIIVAYKLFFHGRLTETQKFTVANVSGSNSKAAFTEVTANTDYIGTGIARGIEGIVNESSQYNLSPIRVKRVYYNNGNTAYYSDWETIQESCGKKANTIYVATYFTKDNNTVFEGYPSNVTDTEKYRIDNGKVSKCNIRALCTDGVNMSGDAEEASIYTQVYYPKMSFNKVSCSSTLFNLQSTALPNVYVSLCDKKATRNRVTVFKQYTGTANTENDVQSKNYRVHSNQRSKKHMYSFLSPTNKNPRQLDISHYDLTYTFLARRKKNLGFNLLSIGTFTEGSFNGSTWTKPATTNHFRHDTTNKVLEANDFYIKFPAEKAMASAVSALLNIEPVLKYFQSIVVSILNDETIEKDEQIASSLAAILSQVEVVNNVLYNNEYTYKHYVQASATTGTATKVKGILYLAKRVRQMEYLSSNANRHAILGNYCHILAYPSTNPTSYPLSDLYNAIADLRMTVINYLNVAPDLELEELLTEASDISSLESQDVTQTISRDLGLVAFALLNAMKKVVEANEQAQIAVVSTRWKDINNDLTNGNSVAKMIANPVGYYHCNIKQSTAGLAKQRLSVTYGDATYKSGDTYYAIKGVLGSSEAASELSLEAVETLNEVYPEKLRLDYSEISNYCLFFTRPNRNDSKEVDTAKYILGTPHEDTTSLTVKGTSFSETTETDIKVKPDQNIDVSSLKVYIADTLLPQYSDATNPYANPNWVFDPTDSGLYITDPTNVSGGKTVQCTYDYQTPAEEWVRMTAFNGINIKSDNEKTKKFGYTAEDDVSFGGFKVKISAQLNKQYATIRNLYPEGRATAHSLRLEELKQLGFECYDGKPSACSPNFVSLISPPEAFVTSPLFTKRKQSERFYEMSQEISQYSTVYRAIAERQMLNPYNKMWSTARNVVLTNSKNKGAYVDVSDIVDKNDNIRTDRTYRYYRWTNYGGTGRAPSGEMTQNTSTPGVEEYFVDFDSMTLSAYPKVGVNPSDTSNARFLSPMYMIHRDYIDIFKKELEDDDKGFFTYLYGNNNNWKKTLSDGTKGQPSQLVNVPIEICVMYGTKIGWQNDMPTDFTLHYGPTYTATTITEGEYTRKVWATAASYSTPYLQLRFNRLQWQFSWFDTPTITAIGCSWS